MKIAVVDDSEEMLAIICKYVVDNKEGIFCECTAFKNSQKLLDVLEGRRQFDIYFLDIEMPGMGGLELAREIRRIQSNAYIVFITSHTDFVLTSYDLSIKAYHYIMKDRMEEKIAEVIKAIADEAEEKKEDFYIIQNKLRYEKLKITDIIYIYKEGKNSVFVLRDNVCRERKALGKVMKQLDRPEFIFIDSGRAVNIRYIRRIEGNNIFLINGAELYVSSSNMRKVKSKISCYWRDIL